MRKQNRIVLAILNAVAFIGVVTVNALANILPINGYNTGELSDLYPNLFVPSGLTFSIWGVIYLLLGLFIIRQFFVAFSNQDTESDGIFERIGIFFVLSSAANIGWILTWHFRLIWLSLLVMLVLLASLIFIYLRLDIRKREVSAAEKWFGLVPFSVYLGWITIATIANVTALLVNLGWNGFGIAEAAWTIIVIAVGTLITLAVLFTRQDIYYSLVAEWAFFGILLKRVQAGGEASTPVIAAVSVCMGIILLGIIFQLVKKRVY